MEKIIYEPHPVTPERKAELRVQGFKIIDAAFKPAEIETEGKPKPRGKKRTPDVLEQEG